MSPISNAPTTASPSSNAAPRADVREWPERLAPLLVYAATLYPIALCFVYTRIVRTSGDTWLVVAETAIAGCAIPVLLARLRVAPLMILLVVVANFLVLALAQQVVDVKRLRDLLMPVLFVWLGLIVANRTSAERVLRNLALLAVVLGALELAFPDLYKSLFDVLSFYSSRGFASDNPYALSVLQLRPEGIGRSLFPALLGARRISSYFLEPIAMGNFAVLTAAWALSKPAAQWREMATLVALSAAMIVLADARFGSLMILILILARSGPVQRLRGAYAIFPLLGMLAVMAVVWIEGSRYVGDNMIGRFQLSGANLLDMPFSAWLGIPATISMDAGYGYIMQRSGVVLCTLLWAAICVVPMKDEQAERFRFNLSLYATSILCVSGSSLFSIKTSAILWLLFGASIASGATGAARPLPRSLDEAPRREAWA